LKTLNVIISQSIRLNRQLLRQWLAEVLPRVFSTPLIDARLIIPSQAEVFTRTIMGRLFTSGLITPVIYPPTLAGLLRAAA